MKCNFCPCELALSSLALIPVASVTTQDCGLLQYVTMAMGRAWGCDEGTEHASDRCCYRCAHTGWGIREFRTLTGMVEWAFAGSDPGFRLQQWRLWGMRVEARRKERNSLPRKGSSIYTGRGKEHVGFWGCGRRQRLRCQERSTEILDHKCLPVMLRD